MNNDHSRRFIFNQTDVRGDIVCLDASLETLFKNHDYPAPVKNLLSEALVAVVLMGSIIKFKGRLVLQARSNGPIKLLMAEVNDQQQIRGYAQYNDVPARGSTPVSELLSNGTLAVTIEPDKGESYQSLVPMNHPTLSACLEHYFQQSEQLNTLIRLVADDHRGSGMLLQQLPPQRVQDQAQRSEDWTRLMLLGDTASSQELLTLSPVELLSRLYHQEDIRLLDEKAVDFFCSCSESRMANALISLGETELDALFGETPTITMNCDICATERSFTRQSLADVLSDA